MVEHINLACKIKEHYQISNFKSLYISFVWVKLWLFLECLKGIVWQMVFFFSTLDMSEESDRNWK